MPGWQMPDDSIWQLVTYIRDLPKTADAVSAAAVPAPVFADHVGSAACESCHADIYARWRKTLMANVVRDPKEHPDAIIARPVARRTRWSRSRRATSRSSTAASGSSATSRSMGDDYYRCRHSGMCTTKSGGRTTSRQGTDWWTAFYPDDNAATSDRTAVRRLPLGELRHHQEDGDRMERRLRELPRRRQPHTHATRRRQRSSIRPVSTMSGPAMSAHQCHSQGKPRTNPIAGQYYDWPVGYTVGDRLSDGLGARGASPWRNHLHALRRRHRRTRIACRATTTCAVACTRTASPASPAMIPTAPDHDALLRKPANELCLHCHGPRRRAGPVRRIASRQHTHHSANSTGSQCIACHMPRDASRRLPMSTSAATPSASSTRR